MDATFEISLNPLDREYASIVTDFLVRLKQDPGIRIEVNGLSTQLFGDYDTIWELLKTEVKPILESYPAVFHLKLGRGILSRENLPETLQ
jgi:uncharacterized protein YqgV (UPF0045/DUF77 family)